MQPDVAKANERQVAGSHYRDTTVRCPHCCNDLQHWDIFGLWPYLEAQVTKYLWRWKNKNGLEDLRKAAHYLQKRIEIEEQRGDVDKVLSSRAYEIRETDLCACPFPVTLGNICGKCNKPCRPRNMGYQDVPKRGDTVTIGPYRPTALQLHCETNSPGPHDPRWSSLRKNPNYQESLCVHCNLRVVNDYNGAWYALPEPVAASPDAERVRDTGDEHP